MESIIKLLVRLVRAAQRSYTKKWTFVALFIVVFGASVSLLSSLDLLPNPPSATAPVVAQVTTTAVVAPEPLLPEAPVKIAIEKIGLDVSVSNPTTTDIEVLDRELLSGAVRYPTSAKLGETGNVVLFGHSSYLPIVKNKAYKAFNDIQKLSRGDTVTVYSGATAYTYAVRAVEKESAVSNAGIPLDVSGRVLTLATCDSFGAKTDRFVVIADFVESYPVST